MDYCVSLDAGEILCYQQAPEDSALDSDSNPFLVSADFENILYTYLMRCEQENANNLISSILLQNGEYRRMYPMQLRCIAGALNGILIRCIREACLPNALDIMLTDRDIRTVPQLHLCLQQSVNALCEKIQATQEKYDDNLMDILNYICDNLSNFDLSVAFVAEHFNATPSALSRKFKRQTGNGLLDYINRQRVQASKKNLKDKKVSLAQVASLVGIDNVNTYIRIFKKYEGLTPGEYRSNCI